MKTSLLMLLMTAALSVFGQTKAFNIITTSVATQTIVWSESEKEHVFIDHDDEFATTNSWMFVLENNHTGTINVTSIQDGEQYVFTIYNWEIREKSNHGDEYTWMDCIQKVDSEKVTIMLTELPEGEFISVFMPESGIALFFSNIVE